VEQLEREGRLTGAARRLAWPGFLNARDLGGLPLGPAGLTRYRALVRSDLPGLYGELDRRVLADYGVRTVIDLRSPRELVDRPNPLGDHHGYRHLPLLLDRDIEHVRDFRDMTRTYRWQVDHRAEAIAEILAAIAAEPAGTVLFHCLAGKDRTGVIAAMLLALAGVERAAVVDDYLLTDGTVPVQFRPLPEMMLGLLDHLDGRHGGVRAYLAAAGVDPAQQAVLRARLTG
jgi:protein tyrosine/serine phosphatase